MGSVFLWNRLQLQRSLCSFYYVCLDSDQGQGNEEKVSVPFSLFVCCSVPGGKDIFLIQARPPELQCLHSHVCHSLKQRSKCPPNTPLLPDRCWDSTSGLRGPGGHLGSITSASEAPFLCCKNGGLQGLREEPRDPTETLVLGSYWSGRDSHVLKLWWMFVGFPPMGTEAVLPSVYSLWKVVYHSPCHREVLDTQLLLL